jgi:hypothetical protein
MSGRSWVGSTLTFTAGTAGEFLVGDTIYWKAAVQSSASPDAYSSYNGVAYSYILAAKVTSVVSTTITAVALGDVAQLDTSDNPSTVYIAHLDWAPARTFAGDLTSGSPTVANATRASALQVGDFVRAAAGLPAIVRVIATPTVSSYTLSKNATGNRTAEPLYLSQLKGV